MINFKLNESEEEVEEFYGRIIDLMPELKKESMVPLSVADLMQKRLESLTKSQELNDYWWTNYFYTGDAVILHPDGRVKIVFDAEPMRELNPKSELGSNLGELILPDGTYDKLDGESFTRKEIERNNNAEWQLSEREAKSHPIWKALAREDQTLLDDYVNAVFYKAKEMYGYDKNMRLWVLPPPLDVNIGVLWTVSSLMYKSEAWGKHSLNDKYARLIGMIKS